MHFNLFRKRSRKCRRKKSRLGEGFDGQVAVVPISWDTKDETFGFPEGCSEHRSRHLLGVPRLISGLLSKLVRAHPSLSDL